MAHSDIDSGDWIDRQLPAHLRPYARLMRLDRPIGTWLLLLPCWWGLTLASPVSVDPWYIVLFAIGAFVMRAAGCVVNDLYDRDIDGKVERTRLRPLVNGDLNERQAIALLVILLLIGLVVLLQFNGMTISVGVLSLLLVFTYPKAKRVTWWPQLVLGFTFNWGILLGWTALHAKIGFPALLLYVGGIFWTLGYDTIYAHQDKNDDKLLGVKSMALYLGEASRTWIAFFMMASLFFIAMAGFARGYGFGYVVLLLPAAAHAAWQLWGWKMNDPANCLQRFRSNRDFGLLVLVALLLGRYV